MSFACQELVYLDVGGTPFKMLRTTVQNYPDSLIAKILKACPQAGQKSQPLYVDRSPKLFDWILEVHRCTSEDAFPSCKNVCCLRNGDYEGSLPRRSAKLLQRELDFYQLPSLEELGLSATSPDSSFSAEKVGRKLMQDIVDEIIESGIEDMHPWCVYIYYEFFCDVPKPRRRIFAIPDAVRSTSLPDILDFLKYRGDDTFVRSLIDKTLQMSTFTKHITVSSPKSKPIYSIQVSVSDLVDLIRTTAGLHGLVAEVVPLQAGSDTTCTFLTLPFIRLRY